MGIDTNQIVHLILAHSSLNQWKDVENLFVPDVENMRPDWELPNIGCRAVCGVVDNIIFACSAIACLQKSIILIDDLLDDDPKGVQDALGWGRAANLAVILQCVGIDLINKCLVEQDAKMHTINTLNQMLLDTAVGQELDAQSLTGEANYWRVVESKSTPFYGAALQIGGQLGNATPLVSEGLYKIGVLIGEVVQIHDDLEDAFQTPANPDWCQGRNNLAILYGLSADYSEHKNFMKLYENIQQPGNLEEAQKILVHCGAVSYCVYHLVQRHQKALSLLDELSLPSPEYVADIFINQRLLLERFLEGLNISLTEDILPEVSIP